MSLSRTGYRVGCEIGQIEEVGSQQSFCLLRPAKVRNNFDSSALVRVFCAANRVRFLPTYSSDHVTVVVDENGQVVEEAGKQKVRYLCLMFSLGMACYLWQEFRHYLELPTWLMAWDRYTVGAVALGQMTHEQAQEHKSVIEEVCFLRRFAWFNKQVCPPICRWPA